MRLSLCGWPFQELDELHHADDREDDHQPVVVAQAPDGQLPADEKREHDHADDQVG
jgi:hypothetical protein